MMMMMMTMIIKHYHYRQTDKQTMIENERKKTLKKNQRFVAFLSGILSISCRFVGIVFFFPQIPNMFLFCFQWWPRKQLEKTFNVCLRNRNNKTILWTFDSDPQCFFFLWHWSILIKHCRVMSSVFGLFVWPQLMMMMIMNLKVFFLEKKKWSDKKYIEKNILSL